MSKKHGAEILVRCTSSALCEYNDGMGVLCKHRVAQFLSMDLCTNDEVLSTIGIKRQERKE